MDMHNMGTFALPQRDVLARRLGVGKSRSPVCSISKNSHYQDVPSAVKPFPGASPPITVQRPQWLLLVKAVLEQRLQKMRNVNETSKAQSEMWRRDLPAARQGPYRGVEAVGSLWGHCCRTVHGTGAFRRPRHLPFPIYWKAGSAQLHFQTCIGVYVSKRNEDKPTSPSRRPYAFWYQCLILLVYTGFADTLGTQSLLK